MGEIYKSASLVVVWLGKEEDDSNAAMNMLRRPTPSFRSAVAPTIIPENKSYEIPKLSTKTWETLKPLVKLFTHPYWSRLWIVQETLLAQQVLLCCGTATCPWSLLEVLVRDDANLSFFSNKAFSVLELVHIRNRLRKVQEDD